MMIDTRHVKDRRLLWFESLEDALGEAERLVGVEREGRLRVMDELLAVS